MRPINQLAAIDKFQPNDQFPVFQTSNGDSRRGAVSLLQAYMQENLIFNEGFTTQRATPSATDFSVELQDVSQNIWLILSPTGTLAAGTVVLPAIASVIDKQEVLVNCTQVVTGFRVEANGAGSVVGAPTNLTANSFFRLRYDQTTNAWYRVG